MENRYVVISQYIKIFISKHLNILNMANIDEMILKALKKHKSLTTYQIAKKLGVSWATVNVHCYRLLAEGKIKVNHESTISGRKTIWMYKEGRRSA